MYLVIQMPRSHATKAANKPKKLRPLAKAKVACLMPSHRATVQKGCILTKYRDEANENQRSHLLNKIIAEEQPPHTSTTLALLVAWFLRQHLTMQPGPARNRRSPRLNQMRADSLCIPPTDAFTINPTGQLSEAVENPQTINPTAPLKAHFFRVTWHGDWMFIGGKIEEGSLALTQVN